MNLKITNDKSITEELNIDLTNCFTIFAGENNSGKTQIIDEIEKKLINNKKTVVKIPADRVILENEITTGAKDTFKENLSKLITLSFTEDSINIDNKIKDITKSLPKLFKEYGIENVELLAEQGSPKNDDYIKACKDLVIKKALDSITIKDTLNGKSGILLKNAGQGVERLAIVSLIRFISSKLNSSTDEAYLLIEEPEIYLHPKLKKSFYEALKKLSTNKTKIVITTHDPYFISLSQDETIYNVVRDNKGLTKALKLADNAKGKLLPYKSNAEINFFVFKLPTIEYALQLYEEFIKRNESKKSVFVEFMGGNKTLVDIRNEIAHADYSPKESELDCFIQSIIQNK